MKTATKPRYRTPSVTVDADVSLDEFDTQKIIGYLRHLGHSVDGECGADESETNKTGCVISPRDLDRIETLSLCGQKEPARELALKIISEAIGRDL